MGNGQHCMGVYLVRKQDERCVFQVQANIKIGTLIGNENYVPLS